MIEVTVERIARVVDFELAGDYKLKLHFDDGEVKVIDFEPILHGPVFGALRDPIEFSKVQLASEFGTIEWPNGADIDPTVLRDWEAHVEAIIERRGASTPFG